MFMEPNHSADKRPQTVRGEGEQGLLIKGQAGVVVTLPQGAVACIFPLARGVKGLCSRP